jgi:CelD/BcsL family acetyltransferase involved in cellulose biosynthesis
VKLQQESIENLQAFSKFAGHFSTASQVFASPVWLANWWQHFGSGMTPLILIAQNKTDTVGFAPFMISDKTVRIMGGTNVCDYLDILVKPESADQVCSSILTFLINSGYFKLDLYPLRPESFVLTHLAPAAERCGCNKIEIETHDLSFEMALPEEWEEYLAGLNSKQRHEIRRKLRRLREFGDFEFKAIDPVEDSLDMFFDMFISSRTDKFEFMTSEMKAFFRDMAGNLSKTGVFKLFTLELSQKPVAAVICFDCHGRISLYNNAYDTKYASLSVGVISKIMSVQKSILDKRHTYDFLKGAEHYKKHLGGTPVTLYRCRISL